MDVRDEALKRLAGMSEDELRETMKSKDTPNHWKILAKQEIDKRAREKQGQEKGEKAQESAPEQTEERQEPTPTPAPDRADPKTERQEPEKKEAAARPRKRRTLDEREAELAARRDALNKELAEIRSAKGKKERERRNHLLYVFAGNFDKEIMAAAVFNDREQDDQAVAKLAVEYRQRLGLTNKKGA